MNNFDLRKFLTENRLDESASSKAFKDIQKALSKYKNVRAGSGDPVNPEIFAEIEEMLFNLL